MLKLSVHFVLPTLLLFAAAAGAQTKHVVATDTTAALYEKCTTVGSDEYDGRQCIAFRAAADKEIATCMSGGAANSHGYRALHFICADAQVRRFSNPAD